MKLFTQLCAQKEFDGSADSILEALVFYFKSAAAEEHLITIKLLTAKTPKKILAYHELFELAKEISGIPDWLFEECSQIVKDRIEAITLIIPDDLTKEPISLTTLYTQLNNLEYASTIQKKEFVKKIWAQLPAHSRYIFNRLVTQSFKITIPLNLIASALSIIHQLPIAVITLRLLNNSNEYLLDRLILKTKQENYLPEFNPIQHTNNYNRLGNINNWTITKSFPSLRVQIIINDGFFVWDDELNLCIQFINTINEIPNGTILNAQLVYIVEGNMQPLNSLKSNLVKSTIVLNKDFFFIINDIVLYDNEVVKNKNEALKLTLLQNILRCSSLLEPEVVFANQWQNIQEKVNVLYKENANGLLLSSKIINKLVLLTAKAIKVTAVLLYVERRFVANIENFAEYTFAIQGLDNLVPICKITNENLDEEIRLIVLEYMREHTIEKFGPVQSIVAKLVFELSAHSISQNNRKKSGIDLLCPTIVAFKPKKTLAQITTLISLTNLLPQKL